MSIYQPKTFYTYENQISFSIGFDVINLNTIYISVNDEPFELLLSYGTYDSDNGIFTLNNPFPENTKITLIRQSNPSFVTDIHSGNFNSYKLTKEFNNIYNILNELKHNFDGEISAYQTTTNDIIEATEKKKGDVYIKNEKFFNADEEILCDGSYLKKSDYPQLEGLGLFEITENETFDGYTTPIYRDYRDNQINIDYSNPLSGEKVEVEFINFQLSSSVLRTAATYTYLGNDDVNIKVVNIDNGVELFNETHNFNNVKRIRIVKGNNYSSITPFSTEDNKTRIVVLQDKSESIFGVGSVIIPDIVYYNLSLSYAGSERIFYYYILNQITFHPEQTQQEKEDSIYGAVNSRELDFYSLDKGDSYIGILLTNPIMGGDFLLKSINFTNSTEEEIYINKGSSNFDSIDIKVFTEHYDNSADLSNRILLTYRNYNSKKTMVGVYNRTNGTFVSIKEFSFYDYSFNNLSINTKMSETLFTYDGSDYAGRLERFIIDARIVGNETHLRYVDCFVTSNKVGFAVVGDIQEKIINGVFDYPYLRYAGFVYSNFFGGSNTSSATFSNKYLNGNTSPFDGMVIGSKIYSFEYSNNISLYNPATSSTLYSVPAILPMSYSSLNFIDTLLSQNKISYNITFESYVQESEDYYIAPNYSNYFSYTTKFYLRYV